SPPQPVSRASEPRRVFLVRGEDGVGESRLLRELRVQCQVEGLPVHELVARGARAYGNFLDIAAVVLRREGHLETLEVLGGKEGKIDLDRLVEPERTDESLRSARFRK